MSGGWTCRSCGHAGGMPVIDLGMQPLANNLLHVEDLKRPEPRFPLRVLVCDACYLMQIADLVPPVELFSDYVYFSSFSDWMVRHAREAVERYVGEFRLGSESLVVEVASNDGYMLRHFQRFDVPALGVEPAANIAAVAEENGVETVVDFFSERLAQRLVEERKQADVILGNNVFAHVPDTNDFVAGLGKLLKAEGSVVLEFPYGVELVEGCEFDTIYHEHVFYFTLAALEPLFGRHGMEVWRVERLTIHGGSLRLFAGHARAHEVEESVLRLREEELEKGVKTPGFYASLARGAERVREEMRAILDKFQVAGARTAAYGASAKGSTLLNYCQAGRERIEFVVDRSTYKQGCFTPGQHLPILPVDALLERQPDYTVLLSWNFADEILEQQRAYRERGGKFVLPVPAVRVV